MAGDDEPSWNDEEEEEAEGGIYMSEPEAVFRPSLL